MSTRYSVRPGSLRHSYRFLTSRDREFACDKITGLVIKRNPWDRWFGTMTLRFWLIGSSEPLEFAHVPCSLEPSHPFRFGGGVRFGLTF